MNNCLKALHQSNEHHPSGTVCSGSADSFAIPIRTPSVPVAPFPTLINVCGVPFVAEFFFPLYNRRRRGEISQESKSKVTSRDNAGMPGRISNEFRPSLHKDAARKRLFRRPSGTSHRQTRADLVETTYEDSSSSGGANVECGQRE